MQNDDVGTAVEGLEGLDFSKRRLVVVDLLERDGEVVVESNGSVHIRVGSGSDPLKDLILCDDFGAAVDAPALCWRRLHVNQKRKKKKCACELELLILKLFFFFFPFFSIIACEAYTKRVKGFFSWVISTLHNYQFIP